MLSQGPINPAFSEVEERVSFMKYDFLEPQPVQEAGLFFLRQITHNYPDDVCVNIFKRLAEALERSPPGTPLLINDMVLPMANTMLKVEEHHLRQLDMAMLNGYAAKQRTQQEFLALLKQADDRLEVSTTSLHWNSSLLTVFCRSSMYTAMELWDSSRFSFSSNRSDLDSLCPLIFSIDRHPIITISQTFLQLVFYFTFIFYFIFLGYDQVNAIPKRKKVKHSCSSLYAHLSVFQQNFTVWVGDVHIHKGNILRPLFIATQLHVVPL